MTDFSPSPVKAAGREAMARYAAGSIAFDDKGAAEVEVLGHIVRMAVAPGCSGPIVRVIDGTGRHWFPDLEGAFQ